MEYISAEEFLKQPVEVLNVFSDYFKLKVGDVAIYLEKPNELCIITEMLPYDDLGGKGTSIMSTNEIGGNEIDTFIKALTEGQLRKFIEDKKDCYISCSPTYKCDGYDITILGVAEETYTIKTDNLIQAYWKVACEIAKGGGLAYE